MCCLVSYFGELVIKGALSFKVVMNVWVSVKVVCRVV